MIDPSHQSALRRHAALLVVCALGVSATLGAALVAETQHTNHHVDAIPAGWSILALGLTATAGAAWAVRTLTRARIAAMRLALGMSRRLADSSERFRALVEDASDCTLICDRDAEIQYASPPALQLLGLRPGQLVGVVLDTLVHAEDRASLLTTLRANGMQRAILLLRMRHADGTWRWVDVTLRDRRSQPAIGGFVLTCLDVSEREHALREHHRAEQRLGLALDTAQVVLWELHLPTGALRLSPQWARLVGGTPGETQTRLEAWSQRVHPDDLPLLLRLFECSDSGDMPTSRIDHRVRAADGQWRWIKSVGRVVEHDAQGQPLRMAGVNIDIHEQRQAAARIEHLAYHDALTGLPNRQLLRDRIAQSIAQAAHRQHHVALLCIELDRFEALSEPFGRGAADALLCGIAERLRGALHESHTLARLGDHRFAVALPEVASVDQAASTAQALLHALSAPFAVGMQAAQDGQVRARVGISLYPHDGSTAAALLDSAEAALRHAKGDAPGDVHFSNATMSRQAQRRVTLEIGLRAALADDGLTLHFQPVVDLVNGRIVGAEALLRWTHAVEGEIPADEFIAIAEECGLIVPLGLWVLTNACRHAQRWQATLSPQLRIAVNLSPRQFEQPDLVAAVQSALARSGLNPGTLELEITESHRLDDKLNAVQTLHRLKREAGVRLVIDDFGTGYSGLSVLRRLPLDKLKIDRSFVRAAVASAADAALLGGIVAIARDLALEITAEGVETQQELTRVKALGCNTVQGFLTGKAMPPDAFERCLAASLAGAV